MIGRKRLVFGLGGGLAGLALLTAATPASALDVPPYRGNDTGGIIAWEYARTIDYRALGADHCGQYDKVAKFVSADRRYGGYVSFHCVWRPTFVVVRSSRVVVRALY
jgi:hypothetical protein